MLILRVNQISLGKSAVLVAGLLSGLFYEVESPGVLNNVQPGLRTVGKKKGIENLRRIQLTEEYFKGFPDKKRTKRKKTMEELLITEEIFVENTHKVVNTYLDDDCGASDWFKPEEILILFSNIREILAFHEKFLQEMKSLIEPTKPETAVVSGLFKRNLDGFSVHTKYCLNIPVSNALIEMIKTTPHYQGFFGDCQLPGLKRMNIVNGEMLKVNGETNSSFDAIIMTPFQRISKYVDLLDKLYENTPNGHEKDELKTAQDGMRVMLRQVNEAMGDTTKIINWQKKVENFNNPIFAQRNHHIFDSDVITEMTCYAYDLVQRAEKRNSRLSILSRDKDGYKSAWTEKVNMQLFDQTIVLCTKKSNTLVSTKNVDPKSVPKTLKFKEEIPLASSAVTEGLVEKPKDEKSFTLYTKSRKYEFTSNDGEKIRFWIEKLRELEEMRPPEFI